MTIRDNGTILIIGAGNMGGAVGKAIVAAGVEPSRLLVANSSAESSAAAAAEIGATSAFEGREAESHASVITAATRSADLVILGFKPYQLGAAAPAIREGLCEGALVLSLLAGVSLDQLAQQLGSTAALVRAMPNTPISVGHGVVALMPSEGVGEPAIAELEQLLAASARVVRVPESQVHGVIGASGSSPAYFFLIAEAMIDEAVAQGFTRDTATALVLDSMLGSAALLKESGQLPAAARYAVTSPGGTTAEAVAVLEESGIRAALSRAMRAAVNKSRAMEKRKG